MLLKQQEREHISRIDDLMTQKENLLKQNSKISDLKKERLIDMENYQDHIKESLRENMKELMMSVKIKCNQKISVIKSGCSDKILMLKKTLNVAKN